MKPILYLETNFVVGVAKGRDPVGDRLLKVGEPRITLAIPTVCFMEAFTVLNAEKKQWRVFNESLSGAAHESSRDLMQNYVSNQLVKGLTQSRLYGEAVANLFEDMIHWALDRLAKDAELIETGPDVINDCLSNEAPDDRTDNLILSSVLAHASRNATVPRAFLSGNHKDFNQPGSQGRIMSVGLKYFSKTEAAVGWLLHQAGANTSRPDISSE